MVPASAWITADSEPSLAVLAAHPRDPAFGVHAVTQHAFSPRTGRKVPYSLWANRPGASLVVIIPGIGAHRTDSLCLVLAEEAYRRGHTVIAVSNPFHPEFIRTGLSARYPGYTPSDAQDLRAVIQAARGRLPALPVSQHLLGYSLGGLAALHIAADESEGLAFDSCVAVNPPVDLLYSAGAFDRYFKEPSAWERTDRQERLEELALRLHAVLTDTTVQRRGFPFTREESELIVGLKSRHTAWTAVTACEGRPPSPGEHKDPLLVWNSLSFRAYIRDRLLPAVRTDDRPTSEWAEDTGLRAVERVLRKPHVQVVTNRDDFILAPEHVAWLRQKLGNRLQLNPSGGHLGNLHREDVLREVFEALAGEGISSGH